MALINDCSGRVKVTIRTRYVCVASSSCQCSLSKCCFVSWTHFTRTSEWCVHFMSIR